MISIKEYYNDVNENFIKDNRLLFEKSLAISFDEDNDLFQGTIELMKLLDAVCEKYDFGLHRQVRPNLQQFYYYQLQISGKADPHRLEVALVFILFCCLADKFLDSPRFSDEEKGCICKKLDAKYLMSETSYESTHFQEMDALLNYLREFLVQQPDTPALQALISDIQAAFTSEIYMSTARLLKNEKFNMKEAHLLIDKSVKFEKSAFLLSVQGDITPDAEKIADSIARIIWLVDDICDLIEDVQCKRKNSLLFLYADENSPISLEKRIEHMYQNLPQVYALLNEEIMRLEKLASPQLYHFIVTQVWDWFKNVRQEAEKRTEA